MQAACVDYLWATLHVRGIGDVFSPWSLYPLTPDHAIILVPMDETPRTIGQEEAHLSQENLLNRIFAAFDELRRRGWREPVHAREGDDLWIIEAGSTGIHKGYLDGFGFWVVDNIDCYPARPILIKPRKQGEEEPPPS